MSKGTAVDQPIFESLRLYARRFQPEDVQDAFTFYGDLGTMSLIGNGLPWMRSPNDGQMIERHIQYYQNHERHGFWAVVLKSTGKVIGHVGVKNILIDGKENLEVAYVINKNFQNQGFGTEITKAATSFAQRDLGAKEIVAVARDTNKASIAVMKKCDMTLRKVVNFKG